MSKKEGYVLAGIFIVVLAIRLFLAFSQPTLTYDSYFHVRHVEHIQETALPLFEDDLSYGSREHITLPVFHYLAAILGFIIPLPLLTKILPNLLFASIIPIVYFLSTKKVSPNKTAALFSAFIAGFLPILFTTNSFTPQSLFIPLTFFAIYSFFQLQQHKMLLAYIVSFVLLCFTSSNTFVILIGFGIYLLLSVLEGKRIKRGEVEVIIFSVFFYLWSQFLFFKDVLREEGVAFIWQNIPPQIIWEYFPKFSLGEALIAVSVIPFLTGIFVVYRSLFHLKNQKAFFLISFAISTTLFTWLRLVEFKLSLAFFGIILAILFSTFYNETLQYLQKTKLSSFKRALPIVVIALLALTIVPPAMSASYQQHMPTQEEVVAFEWIEQNTPDNIAIAALLEEGHLVTQVSKRQNIMDNQFTMINDAQSRFSHLHSLYTTSFQTQAIDILNTYNARYIVISPRAQAKYDIKNIKYLSDACFRRVYTNATRIYAVNCELSQKE